ncbi:MAG: hypothetical protein ACJ8AW_18410 [Rhodopila sp.]
MEPPDDIEVPNGLSPQRARLVRYVGWLARLRGELDDAVSGRAAFLATMKVPSLTRAAIQQLIADDKSGLVGLMTRGGEGVSMHSLRSHERKLLLEQLVADEHAAEVAGSALTEVEKTIDSLERQIQVVSGRHGEFVAAVVQEHILSGVGATLTEQMDRIQASGLDVMGAHGAIAALRNVSHFPVSQRWSCLRPGYR